METKCSYLIVLVPGPHVEHFAPEGYFLLPQGQTTPRALTGRGLEDTAQPASLFGGLSAFTAKHEGLASAKPQGILEEMQPAGDGCVCSEDELDGPRDDPQTASVSQTDTLQPKIQKSHQLKKHLRRGKKKITTEKASQFGESADPEPRDTQRMFFVPSVQKPSASLPPPHSRISPPGLSETVQGSSAARAKPALAAPGARPKGDPREPHAWRWRLQGPAVVTASGSAAGTQRHVRRGRD